MTSTTQWVEANVGGRLTISDPAHEAWGLGLALRRNPRRAHLLVNPALAKHVPVDPDVARSAATDLALAVRDVVDPDDRCLVIGFAETATGLGQLFAEAFAPVDFITTTRVFDDEVAEGHLAFAEEHSHAVAHRLTPRDPGFLRDRDVVVLVDDELSTGRTAFNALLELRRFSPRATFVIATLVDARPLDERDWFVKSAADAGLSATVVGLDRVEVTMPSDAVATVAAIHTAASPAEASHPRRILLPVAAPGELPRLGMSLSGTGVDSSLEDLVAAVCAAWMPEHGATVQVLGDEEQIHLPVLLAERLVEEWAALDVRVVVSSTTRSPIVVIDEDGYPVRSAVTYQLRPEGQRHAYNLSGADAVVLVPEVVPGRLAALGDLLPLLPVSVVLTVDWT